MSNPTRGLSSGQNPSWSLAFWNRVHRYRVLVQKFWWVLVLTLSICLFAAAWHQINRPLTYLSTASMTVDLEHTGPRLGGDQAGSVGADSDDYMAKQIPFFVKGHVIQQMAAETLQAKYPDMLASPVSLGATHDNGILSLTATGSNPEYTQRYLQAIVKAFFDSRRNDRLGAGDDSFKAIRSEIKDMQVTLNDDDAATNAFQRKNNVVFDKESGNAADNDLAAKRQKLATLRDEQSQLALMTPEQGLKGTGSATRQAAEANGGVSAQPSPGVMDASASAEGEFRQANSQLVNLRAALDDLSHDLRPKHPKIIALKEQIDTQEKQIANLLSYSREQIKLRQAGVAAMIRSVEAEIPLAEKKAFDVNILRTEFKPLQDKKERDLAHFNDLNTTLTKGVSSTTIETESMHVLDPVSVAEPVPSSWTKMLALAVAAGLAVGVAILALIDRMDDRMGSINDFRLHFSETVLGQIPRDATAGEETELLKSDDPRHQLVESFRNLRSTLLYMPLEGKRPKTLLVTSAVPNEGKSTLSCNLALVMAFAGMKTLLIDADLRRGAIHNAFNVTRDPGLTDVLGHNVNWKIAIRQTKVENLHVLPRGRNVPQPSEYLLNKNTDRLLQELYPLYDYIIIDSSPVLAADDTASLAPKIDATLFVARMSFTSAKMTRKSLEILYDRQANIPGLILNQVDTSSPEFVYYQYSEYYHAATDEDDGPDGKGGEDRQADQADRGSLSRRGRKIQDPTSRIQTRFKVQDSRF